VAQIVADAVGAVVAERRRWQAAAAGVDAAEAAAQVAARLDRQPLNPAEKGRVEQVSGAGR
jgi:hypothetical protein